MEAAFIRRPTRKEEVFHAVGISALLPVESMGVHLQFICDILYTDMGPV